jgi:hypothetical protein
MRIPIAVAAAALLTGCGSSNKYEVVQRTEKDVPNYREGGTHTEVDYVLLHDGHKIYASCDVTSIGNLDPSATCGFRPLHKYECEVQSDSMQKAQLPMSDLKCKDADGHHVYLYVSKKD